MDKLNILVIEDYTPDVVLIQAYLEEAALNTNLFHTPTLSEGISIVKENPVDIVLLDLSLNDTAGFNTLKKFLKEAPSVPVIVMTGLKNEVVGIQAVRAGAQDFLIKGEFDSRELVRHIRYALQRWRTKFELIKKTKQLEKQKKKSIWSHGVVKFGNWEMNLVDRSMKWEDEMFRIFGFEPNSFSPTLSDYLNYVHLEDREKVDEFFDKVIREASLKKMEHRIIVSGTVIKHIRVHAQVSIDDATDKILLIGGVQDVTDQKRSSDASANDHNNRFTHLFGKVYPPFYPMIGQKCLSLLRDGQPKDTENHKATSEWDSFEKAFFGNYLKLLQLALVNGAHFSLEEESFDFRRMIKSLASFVFDKKEIKDRMMQIQYAKNFPEKLFTDPNWLFLLVYTALHQVRKQDESRIPDIIRFELVKNENNDKVLHIAIHFQFQRATVISEFSKPVLLNHLDKTDDQSDVLNLLTILEIIKVLNGTHVINVTGENMVRIQLSVPINNQEVEELAIVEGEKTDKASTTVLIAEDHPINRIKIKNLLSGWPNIIQIKEAVNGKEAIAITNEEKFDVILMDIKMPIMDGIEATSRIRKQSEVPIIALTNELTDSEREVCYSAGANAYLKKPLKQDQLFEAIQTLLEQ